MTDDDRNRQLPYQRRSRWRKGPLVVALVLAVAGVTVFVSQWRYKHHAYAMATKLAQPVAAPPPTRGPQRACTAAEPSAPTPSGTARAVLQIPDLGVNAPILAGTSDATLDDGVGHLTTSRWPDQGGTDVLEAHNVTFFTHLPSLHPGDPITIVSRCRSWTYTVHRQQVVHEGAPVRNDPSPTLVLVTCWPTDALYFTSSRYVVTATLTSVSNAAPTLPRLPNSGQVHARVPDALRHTDLGLDRFSMHVGTLRVHAVNRTGVDRGNVTFAAATQALHSLVAAELTADARHPRWWAHIAPQVPYDRASVLRNVEWLGSLDITVTTDSGAVTGATISAPVKVAHTGTRHLTARFAVTGRTLTLRAITL